MSRRRPWAGTRSLQAQALDAAHPVPVHGLHRASEEVGDGARVVLILREGIERRSLSCWLMQLEDGELDHVRRKQYKVTIPCCVCWQ